MTFKTYLYVINIFLVAYSLTGVNFDKIIKRNKIVESKILIIILSFVLSYLLTNCIVDLFDVFKIVK